MLLTLTTTYQPATDLGYLLHKNPFRAQAFRVSFGKVYVFYPEANEERCQASLLLDLDLTGLILGRRNFPRDQYLSSPYLNDLPYRASSFLSAALSQVFGTAMLGQSRERSELAGNSIPLTAELSLIACADETIFARLFEPLGYQVSIEKHDVPEEFSNGGGPSSEYYTLRLEANCRLSELLTHLYVLVPVLDPYKHFWHRDFELERFLRRGEGWLENHPAEKMIKQSYTRKSVSSTYRAISRILGENASPFPHNLTTLSDPLDFFEAEELETILDVLKEIKARKVIDLSCGEGKLLKKLSEEGDFEEIVGMDISSEMLEKSRLYLELDSDSEKNIRLIHGSLTYRDKYLKNFDTTLLLDVLPSLDSERLSHMERSLFEYTKPSHLIFSIAAKNSNSKNSNHSTSGGVEQNLLQQPLPEWSREHFETWGNRLAEAFQYSVSFSQVETSVSPGEASRYLAVFTINDEIS